MNGNSPPDIPPNVKLGKAKAMEVVILPDGARLLKKAKVRYWLERQGAHEDFLLLYNDKIHRLSTLEFKRKFKIIIKSGEVKSTAVTVAD
jgi:hypothetical protein